MSDALRLTEIATRLGGSADVIGDDPVITSVTHDSREVGPGSLFVAIPGATADGHDFVDRAFASGAAAVAVDHTVAGPSLLVVPDTRAALPWIAAAVFGDPSGRLPVVGVTGTNGKTTVTYLLEQIVIADGQTPGVVGTIGARIGDTEASVSRTTPEASKLQRLLAEMIEAGVDIAAIEVSSHALSLHRVDAIRFRVAAFTNLMQDHLDYHGDMSRYFAAKASLFTPDRVDHAVIGIDDEAGRRIARDVNLPITTVAIAGDADITASSIVERIDGTSFNVGTPAGTFPVHLPIAGRFNVQNALVAAGIAMELGITTESITRGLASVGTIPGRFEHIPTAGGPGIVVDYAHTPDAIKAVVDGARTFVDGKVIVVFGAGGDRDREKRPAMGRAAGSADLVILTTDNPRSEQPETILAAVKSGLEETSSVVEEPDRRLAIRLAIQSASPDDVVLILGKGHETGQEIAGRTEPFDDRVVAGEEAVRAAEVSP
ncbi:MAG: UDP-N-acetylmuramoyl-L-alanyl-D-glutamate--2,6-diaminopimelate ligase [Acidimicrobiia bacterium]